MSAQQHQLLIEALSDEGKGIGRLDNKVVFVNDCLPGEQVLIEMGKRSKRFDDARLLEIIKPSTERVAPKCQHFGVCGGCSLQHLHASQQIQYKQQSLLDKLQRIGKSEPEQILQPLTAESWGYRTKARLGAKYVPKKGGVIVGFRERQSRYLAQLLHCDVLHPAVGDRLPELAQCIEQLSVRDQIPQVEIAVADNAVSLVFRHLQAVTDEDIRLLQLFGEKYQYQIYLQPKGPSTIHCIYPSQPLVLHYQLPAHDCTIEFDVTDFTQVNRQINQQMVDRALDLLELKSEHRVLDLFCGLGNFSLPLARRAAAVTGVEGDESMVQKATANAERNGIANAKFYCANLFEDCADQPWMGQQYDRLLLDPPRSGAFEIVKQIERFNSPRIVYVSCDPATLARDTEVLVHQKNYRLLSAGVMDMFPHTAHVESIAVFQKK